MVGIAQLEDSSLTPVARKGGETAELLEKLEEAPAGEKLEDSIRSAEGAARRKSGAGRAACDSATEPHTDDRVRDETTRILGSNEKAS